MQLPGSLSEDVYLVAGPFRLLLAISGDFIGQAWQAPQPMLEALLLLACGRRFNVNMRMRLGCWSSAGSLTQHQSFPKATATSTKIALSIRTLVYHNLAPKHRRCSDVLSGTSTSGAIAYLCHMHPSHGSWQANHQDLATCLASPFPVLLIDAQTNDGAADDCCA